MARVFVAMSGGVDSSVAAALLSGEGHDVTGVTMRLLASEDDAGRCCSLDGARSAKRVCDTLGIAHYTLEFTKEFEREVIERYCDEYAAGRTPNPCVACNDRIKFSELMRRVALQGADYLATGHYARIVTAADGMRWLARGVDQAKDQSYFLYRITPAQLGRTLFPLGELTKAEVRDLARSFGLPTAERPESQETCFVPDHDVRAFVRERRPDAFVPGEIRDAAGAVVGTHDGVTVCVELGSLAREPFGEPESSAAGENHAPAPGQAPVREPLDEGLDQPDFRSDPPRRQFAVQSDQGSGRGIDWVVTRVADHRGGEGRESHAREQPIDEGRVSLTDLLVKQARPID